MTGNCSVDPRAYSEHKLVPPAPLPHVSRHALRRVKDWMPPPTCCPYCDGPVRLVVNSEIYRGRAYGDWPYAYLCRPCDAFVGLHPETDLPLGTLANRELREARKVAKRLWSMVASAERMDRTQAYAWLAKRMRIPPAECHFGHFNLQRAALAFNICDLHLSQGSNP